MQKRARARIPGGTQLLSKRPEMFAPGQWPGYYSKAKGAEVWDLDDNKYIDMSISGIGANILGFADTDVDEAAHKCIEHGTSSSLNCPEEIELADLMCEIHDWADMVRYARSGGESMAIAVRIARAHTGKDKIAFCGYHGWHDWYLAANLSTDEALNAHLLPGLKPAGVPQNLVGSVIPFRYNQYGDIEKIVKDHGHELAAIVMEPIRSENPSPGYLQRIRELANDSGAVLIFDEITSGFRLNSGGAHLLFAVNPDLAIFAKAVSNGYSMGVILGREHVMQSAQNTFISSTSWTERLGPVTALATIRKHRRLDVSSHLIKIGKQIQNGWEVAAENANLGIHVSGIPPLSHFSFNDDDDLSMMTLYTQFMLEKGFLASGRFYATYAQKDHHVKSFLAAVKEVFMGISTARKNNKIMDLLKGPVAHQGFRRLA